MELGPGQRQVLLFANGKRSVEELMSRVPEIQDDPDLLFAMESDGLIEMYDADLNEVVGSGTQSKRAHSDVRDEELATAESEPQDSLGNAKREIEADLYELLGRDANAAIAKLQQANSPEKLRQLMPKLLNLAKLSGGVKAGERFNRKHARWLA
jgi:hypothetical protein